MGSYETVAKEYYEEARHPTCADFREVSSRLLSSYQRDLSQVRVVVEVGAGRSVKPDIWRDGVRGRATWITTDASAAMLASGWNAGTMGAVADARRMPIASSSADAVVSSLGDPYNVPAFWNEVHRVLAHGGLGFYTTPSYEWASKFRGPNDRDIAAFELSDGTAELLPSFIHPEDDQVAMIGAAGLEVKDVLRGGLAAALRRSSKLHVVPPGAAVVAAYFVFKP